MKNNDFKYVMQDMTNVYIGANYTYDELMDTNEVPFKLKTIISHYMLKEVSGDTTIENHIFYLKPDSLSYLVYKQMKASFKMSIFEENGHGKNKPGYTSHEYKIDDIMNNSDIYSKRDQIIVEEMHLTKLSLFSVSI